VENAFEVAQMIGELADFQNSGSDGAHKGCRLLQSPALYLLVWIQYANGQAQVISNVL
jgi:hypothetical protein